MYYVKIPLRYLVKGEHFEQRKREVLVTIARHAQIPCWAISDKDLKRLKVEEGPAELPPEIIVLGDDTKGDK